MDYKSRYFIALVLITMHMNEKHFTPNPNFTDFVEFENKRLLSFDIKIVYIYRLRHMLDYFD